MSDDKERRRDIALAKLRHYALHLSCMYGDGGDENIDHNLHCCDWNSVVEICDTAHKRIWPPVPDEGATAIAKAYYPSPVEKEKWEAAVRFGHIAIKALQEIGWINERITPDIRAANPESER